VEVRICDQLIVVKMGFCVGGGGGGGGGGENMFGESMWSL